MYGATRCPSIGERLMKGGRLKRICSPLGRLDKAKWYICDFECIYIFLQLVIHFSISTLKYCNLTLLLALFKRLLFILAKLISHCECNNCKCWNYTAVNCFSTSVETRRILFKGRWWFAWKQAINNLCLILNSNRMKVTMYYMWRNAAVVQINYLSIV